MFSKIGVQVGIALGLTTIGKIVDIWRSGKSESLIDYTQTLRVEPRVLIDADALYSEALPHVQQSLLSLVSGYYLQAVALKTTVGKIDVMRTLDGLNPRRSIADNAVNSAASVGSWLMATESYKFALPTFEKQIALEELDPDEKDRMMREKHEHASNADFRQGIQSHNQNQKHQHDLAKDAATLDINRQNLDINKSKLDDSRSASEISFGRDTLSTVKELANLSVGKLLSVEITDGIHKASIPVSVRLMASSLPSASLVHILSHDSKDNSAKERYHAWKSGELQFIKDLILCQDLIDAHRKNLMHDADGTYSSLIKRQRTNQLATIVSGNPSIASASNCVIMTTETLAKLELHLDGKFSKFAIREKVLKDTSIMLVAVIDKHWDRCTIFSRGIEETTELGLAEMKTANKGGGADVSDILKAYQLSNSPSL